jgi:hypothetical protein
MKTTHREIIDPHQTADYDPHFVKRVERLKRTFRPAVLRRTIGEIPEPNILKGHASRVPD